ncbi:hypothetical protein HOLleu_44663 [Holothuria leucospilota]|uniref:Secreted protein n=1 Tax=Holothuria leucospilota TaxID=206669 RepID=A0A9Q0Y9G7_HOLLE|nr:hypothetical protein HOLleu_44663 [Holothuria leucospilota]
MYASVMFVIFMLIRFSPRCRMLYNRMSFCCRISVEAHLDYTSNARNPSCMFLSFLVRVSPLSPDS